MPISYPLTPPSTPVERTITLSARSVVAVTASPFTLSQQVQEHQGQAWAVSLALPPMPRAAAEAWIAFLLQLHGRLGTFLFGPAHGATARGIATGTPLVDGAAQTGYQLDTDGWTPNTAGILLAGDFIQLGSGSSSRLHKVLADVASDADGDATLTLWPNLRSAPANDAAIVVASPKGLWRLAANEASWDVDVAQHFGLSIDAEEAL